MAARPDVPLVVRFGPFEADVRSGELHRNGAMVRLQQRPFQLLMVLLEHPGRLVTREELRQRLWEADTFVDFDSSLNTAITKLREALGDSAEEHRYIETLARRGYRFVAAVEPPPRPPRPMIVQSLLPSDLRKEIRNPQPGLRRIRMLALVSLPALLILLIYVAYFRSQPASPEARVMLAVLPFDNLGPDVSEEYLSDGLTEETITQLGELSPDRLGVIARTSAMRYKKTRQGIDQIGRELHVNYIVEGSIRKEADRVRVTAQLIRVHDQTHLWAASYDRNIGGVLDLQAEIAQAIANAIEIKLSPEQQTRLASIHPVSIEAHEAYLRGRYLWSTHTEEGLKRSIEYFQQAITKEPNYAQAYAGLAASYGVLGATYLPARDMFPKCKVAAMKALEIDPTLAYGYATLGAYKLFYEWDWPGAEAALKRAVQLNPNDGEAHELYASYLEAKGRVSEAVAEMHRAHELDPLSLNSNVDLGNAYFYAHEYDRAIEQYRRTIEIGQEFSLAYSHLGLAYVQKHDYDRAIAALEQVDTSGKNPGAAAVLGYALGMAGKRTQALRQVARVQELQKKQYAFPEDIALLYVGLGDKNSAFEWLDKAVEEHSWVIFLNVDPSFDHLRDDPRFDQLLQRIFSSREPKESLQQPQ